MTTTEYSGNVKDIPSILKSGLFIVETFVGSAQVMISQSNEKNVLVTIFCITSLTSGDPNTHFPGNNYSKPLVRDPLKEGSAYANNFGNISQTYSFTLSIDFESLQK